MGKVDGRCVFLGVRGGWLGHWVARDGWVIRPSIRPRIFDFPLFHPYIRVISHVSSLSNTLCTIV